jgi:RimJ/RimL family protein N-acetyltransferase
LPQTETQPRDFPWSVPLGDFTLGDSTFTFRRMTPGDREAMLAFARSLPALDLLFLRNDITQPEVVDGWLRQLEAGRAVTLLVLQEGRLLAYGSLHHSESLWTRHLGEILMLVGPEARGRGVGGLLARKLIAIAQELGLQKLWVQMMSTFHQAQDLFHHLGFIPEAMLHDWVIDGHGRTHDLLMMAREVDGEEAGNDDADEEIPAGAKKVEG